MWTISGEAFFTVDAVKCEATVYGTGPMLSSEGTSDAKYVFFKLRKAKDGKVNLPLPHPKAELPIPGNFLDKFSSHIQDCPRVLRT